MKKRIALFANGWGSEYLQEIGRGVLQCAKQGGADVFSFVNFSSHAGDKADNTGEFNIFKLPDLRDFDGAILLTNSFNMTEEIDYLLQRIQETGIPAVSLEYRLQGIDYMGTDNYSGMYELTEHLIREHGVERILFVGGFASHMESKIRLKAVLDAAKENGLQVPKENILYGNWAENPAREQVGMWMKAHDYLPDAVICANDIMAVAICDWMNEQGYSVPEDVKITGYDCIRLGREHRPVITSVSRNWDKMGYQAMQQLFDRMAERETEKEIEFAASLVCGESCGCSYVEPHDDQAHRKTGKTVDGFSSDSHFRHMYLAVRKDETAEEFNGSLSEFCSREGWMEGQDFMLCLHPMFFSFSEQEDLFKTDGYSETVEIICAMKRGVPQPHRQSDTRRAIFLAAEENELPGSYIFVPVRSDEKNFGFAVLSRNFEVVGNNILYIWTRHMNQYLEQVRSNVKIAELTKRLRELSVTDILTGVYNRTGCEKVIYPFLGKCQKRGGRSVVLMADIDRMKTINDKFGHGQGDLALCIVSSVLRKALPQGFLVGRFGGDEFFVGGESDGVTTVEEIIDNVNRELEKEMGSRHLSFELTLSIGGVELEAGETFDLNSSLQRADESMYKVKRRHHEEDEPED